MPYRMDNICGILGSHGFQRVKSLLNNIFGNSYQIINQSLLLSCSGTECQKWHQDGPHLVPDRHLPCHCLNMYRNTRVSLSSSFIVLHSFIPLVDMSDALGPTEFRCKSHFITRTLAESFLLAVAKKTLGDVVCPILKRGSLVMVWSHIQFIHPHTLMSLF